MSSNDLLELIVADALRQLLCEACALEAIRTLNNTTKKNYLKAEQGRAGTMISKYVSLSLIGRASYSVLGH